mmetsp:Transcript_16073/g.16812  ORF Transcript_16073/g.16812 Transcript_16073/m.16812 type:complete len:149 (+) Transcript_16073:40-486(+)
MQIVCLAYVGKTNEPIFVYTTDSDDSESLQLHSIVHCALDIVDEKRGKRTSTTLPSTDMYLGQLYSVEDYRVFGYCTNTMMKIIAVCDSSTLEIDLKDSFQQFHDAFVSVIQNPFQQLGHPLNSVKFQEKVKSIIKRFNSLNTTRPPT